MTAMTLSGITGWGGTALTLALASVAAFAFAWLSAVAGFGGGVLLLA
jgi:hypothetical protein